MRGAAAPRVFELELLVIILACVFMLPFLLYALTYSVLSGKECKGKVTVLLGSSVIGDKLKPLVIGKAANPRCFKGVNRDALGVYYESNPIKSQSLDDGKHIPRMARKTEPEVR